MDRQQRNRWQSNGTIFERLMPKLRRVILAIPTLLVLLAFTNGNPAVPVYAASSVTSAAAPVDLHGNISTAAIQQLMTNSAPPSAQQLALARAYFKAHPLQGTLQRMSSAPAAPRGGLRPNISVGIYWWGYRLHLTNADVTSLFTVIVEAGAGAVAAALCIEAGPVAILCALAGAFVGWLVVTVVLQATNNFGGCGVNIDYNYWRGWRWYCA
jgi:hypothetical protein